MALGSGGHRAYTREDGSSAPERRGWDFQRFMDQIIPLAILGLLAWLLRMNSENGALLATLVERTGNQTRATEAEREDRRSADKFLQDEFDGIKRQIEEGKGRR